MAVRKSRRAGDHPTPAPENAGSLEGGGAGTDRARRESGLALYPPGALKPSKNWYIRGAYLGVSVYRSAKTGRRKDAEREMRRIQREIEDGREISRRGPPLATFADAAARYLEDCPAREAAFVKPLILYFGETPLDEIETAEVWEAAKAIYPKRQIATRNRQAVAPAAAILHRANDLKLCEWKRIKRFKEPRAKTQFIRPEQAKEFLEASPQQLAVFALFLMSTGCRIGEALDLDVADLDLDRATARFIDTKNDDAHTAYLPEALVETLRSCVPARGRVFYWYKDRFAVYRDWRPIAKSLGMPQFTPHICRHSAATWARQAGHDLKFLMEAFGWKDLKSTARYAHIDASSEVRAGINNTAISSLPSVKIA